MGGVVGALWACYRLGVESALAVVRTVSAVGSVSGVVCAVPRLRVQDVVCVLLYLGLPQFPGLLCVLLQ